MITQIRFYIIIACILLVGCKSDTNDAKRTPSQPVNIIVIIDVSDRLFKDKLPGQERQAAKDIKIAKGIINQYEAFAKQTLYIGNRHRLAFVVPKQPGIQNLIPQKTLESLKIWTTDKDRIRGAPRFKEMKTELIKTIEDLYQFIEGRQEFTGSDIWGWFKVSAKEHLQEGARNYIVCLSDGYLYLNNDYLDTLPKRGNKTAVIRHSVVEKFSRNPNWETEFIKEGYGLLPIGEDFSSYNVKFLMVEVGLPVLKVKDLPILEKYWRPWLADMGIPDADFLHTQDDPQVAIDKIKEFLTPTTITIKE